MNSLELKVIQGGVIGTNTYILSVDKRCFVIDCVPETLEYINKNELTPDYIFITHIHYDHIESLSEFIERFKGLKIIINEYGYKNIKDPTYTLNIVSDIDFIENQVIRFKEKFVMNYNNMLLNFLNTPGHSIDSSVMYITDKRIIFSGDTIFCESIGRTDFVGGNLFYLKKSIKMLFDCVEDDYDIYPGHGEKTNVKHEKLNNIFICKEYK